MFWYRNDPDADGVGVAFTDARHPGGWVLDLSVDGQERAEAWRDVEEALGVPVVQVQQVHGARVVGVSRGHHPWLRESADAMVTVEAGIGMAVRVADCLPVALADARCGVAAIAHAGRAGLVAGVLGEAVSAMRARGAERLVAWIGPHICGACYEVPVGMRDAVAAVLPEAACQTAWGTPALDLGAAAARQLADLGCEVRRHDPCTRTTPTLHSFRRDGARSGRQAGIVWIPRR